MADEIKMGAYRKGTTAPAPAEVAPTPETAFGPGPVREVLAGMLRATSEN